LGADGSRPPFVCQPRAKVAPTPGIIDRLYQHEAVKKVVERFAEKKRKALLVQATGAGKTRVAAALCDALIRAKRARRILFLCDRRELRKQANNVFKEFLPGEPRTIITSGTAHERDKRIYLASAASSQGFRVPFGGSDDDSRMARKARPEFSSLTLH
jgi:type I restriction enzyme R subunit